MARQLPHVARIIAKEFCARNNRHECTRVLGHIGRSIRNEPSILKKAADDINSHNQLAKVFRIGGYGFQVYGACCAFNGILSEHASSLRSSVLYILAFTATGIGIVVGTDLRLDVYISNKLNHEVSPCLESIRNTINNINEESEEIGSLCADPAEINVTHCYTNTTIAIQRATSQDIIHPDANMWSAFVSVGKKVLLAVGIVTTSFVIGSSVAAAVGSVYSVVKNEEHPTAAQINQVVASINKQKEALEPIVEQFCDHMENQT